MAHLRAAWRLLAFAIFTAIMFAIVILVRVVCVFAPQTRMRLRKRLFRAWARVVAALVGMHVEVSGQPPLAPVLLIANHLSYMDIVLLAQHVDAIFVAKTEVASWPFLGPVVSSVNTIFVDRGRRRDLLRVNREIARVLDAGEGVVVFAEGTSSDGSQVLPLKPSMLEVALEECHAVNYARLAYATPEDAPGAGSVVCWWDDTPLLTHLLRVFRLPRFDALVHFGPDAVVGRDRKELAHVLRDKISALTLTRKQASNAN